MNRRIFLSGGAGWLAGSRLVGQPAALEHRLPVSNTHYKAVRSYVPGILAPCMTSCYCRAIGPTLFELNPSPPNRANGMTPELTIT